MRAIAASISSRGIFWPIGMAQRESDSGAARGHGLEAGFFYDTGAGNVPGIGKQ